MISVPERKRNIVIGRRWQGDYRGKHKNVDLYDVILCKNSPG